MQRAEECPNCHKNISVAKMNIHILKCTSISLLRSSRMSQRSQDSIESQFKFTESKIIKPPHKQRNFLKPFHRHNKDIKSCIFCLQNYAAEQIQSHMAYCENRLISCNYCRDMFPKPLMNEHQRVCRGKQEQGFRNPNEGWNQYQYQTRRMSQNQQKNNKRQGSRVPELITGLSNIGSRIFQKGIEYGSKAKEYCNKIINQRRQEALQNIEKVQRRLVELLQNAIIIYIEQANIENEGMVSEEIDRLQKIRYKAPANLTDPDVCTICYCQLENNQELTRLKCRHMYHPDCIQKWLKINSTCPVCKSDQRNHRNR